MEKIIYSAEIQENILYITLSGNYGSLSDLMNIADIVVSKTTELDVYSVIIDLRSIKENIGWLDNYDFGNYIAQTWKSKLKAVFISNPQTITKLFENVAVNRGANIKVAANIEEAQTWFLF